MSNRAILGANVVEREPFNQLVEAGNTVQSFGLLYPGEANVLTFSFEPILAEENALLTTLAPVVTVTCVEGNDNNPQAICPSPGQVIAVPLNIETPAGGIITIPALNAVQLAVLASLIHGAIYDIMVKAASTNPQVVPICAGRLVQWGPPSAN